MPRWWTLFDKDLELLQGHFHWHFKGCLVHSANSRLQGKASTLQYQEHHNQGAAASKPTPICLAEYDCNWPLFTSFLFEWLGCLPILHLEWGQPTGANLSQSIKAMPKQHWGCSCSCLCTVSHAQWGPLGRLPIADWTTDYQAHCPAPNLDPNVISIVPQASRGLHQNEHNPTHARPDCACKWAARFSGNVACHQLN